MRLFLSLLQKLMFGASQQRKRSNRLAGIEMLETRRQWAGDLSIISFSANGTDFTVDYEVANQAAQEFDIAVYRSFDGVTLDDLLTTKRIDLDLDVGSFQAVFSADFSDLAGDYQLIAVLDSAGENSETDESNNQAVFGGGIFFDRDYVLHVQGAAAGDTVYITQDEYLYIEFNGATKAFLPGEIAAMHVRLHDSDDYLSATSDIATSLVIYGGAGSDYLEGGIGKDTFFGGLGDDTLLGGAGDDALWGEGDNDNLFGGDGDDFLNGGNGIDALNGGGGADTLTAGDDGTEYYGYGDMLDAGEGDDTIYGSPFDDIIYGGVGNDTIYGLAGNDQIFGAGGSDALYGGDGDDYIYGGTGADTLDGEAGDDSLFGEEGDDALYGDSGNDYLVGGLGSDSFNGGGQTGDVVGDLPTIENFMWVYDAVNHIVTVTGTITDDEPFTGLHASYEGDFTGTIPLDANGDFDHDIIVANPTTGWIYILFTDSEGLEAERMEFCIL